MAQPINPVGGSFLSAMSTDKCAMSGPVTTQALVLKTENFYKTCFFLGKLLLLIHFNPDILLHPDQDGKFISAWTKYEVCDTLKKKSLMSLVGILWATAGLRVNSTSAEVGIRCDPLFAWSHLWRPVRALFARAVKLRQSWWRKPRCSTRPSLLATGRAGVQVNNAGRCRASKNCNNKNVKKNYRVQIRRSKEKSNFY